MGIFDQEVDLYKTWTATLQFRGWLIGGQPKEPKALREMLIRKANLADTGELLRAELTRLAREYEIEITPNMPLDEIEKLVEAKATKSGNGFFQDDTGLYIGAYQVKAMFKEACNIVYAGQRWGKTSKGAKSYLSERLFVSPERIYLDRTEPDGVLIKTGVVTGQQGKRSIMTQAEYVNRPRISFDVRIAKDSDDLLAAIPKLWVTMQDEGLGAMRSSGHGTFDLTAWKPVRALRQVA
jgi:hypothetical protein